MSSKASTRDPFAALADPTRRSILDLLRGQPTITAGSIASQFPALSRPAVSKHLRVLREAKLVSAYERGREWHYSLDPGPLGEMYRNWLARFAPLWEKSLEQLQKRVEGEGE